MYTSIVVSPLVDDEKCSDIPVDQSSEPDNSEITAREALITIFGYDVGSGESLCALV